MEVICYYTAMSQQAHVERFPAERLYNEDLTPVEREKILTEFIQTHLNKGEKYIGAINITETYTLASVWARIYAATPEIQISVPYGVFISEDYSGPDESLTRSVHSM